VKRQSRTTHSARQHSPPRPHAVIATCNVPPEYDWSGMKSARFLSHTFSSVQHVPCTWKRKEEKERCWTAFIVPRTKRWVKEKPNEIEKKIRNLKAKKGKNGATVHKRERQRNEGRHGKCARFKAICEDDICAGQDECHIWGWSGSTRTRRVKRRRNQERREGTKSIRNGKLTVTPIV
jgi:hypothetical protein